MTFLTYRASITPTVPGSTTAKGSALTNDEIDGNFKSVANSLTNLLTGVGVSGTWGIDISGNAATATLATTTTLATNATNATNATVTNDTVTATPVYLTWAPNNSGNNGMKVTSTKLSFVPSTGILSATGFSGPLTGNASTATTANSATTATTATNANNSAITDDTSTNATMYPLWATAATGNLPLKVSSTKISFNPSLGKLTTTALTTSAANGWTAAQYVVPTVVTSSTSITLNLSAANDFRLVLAHNTTLQAPTGAADGMGGRMFIKQGSSGGPYTMAFNAAWKFPAGVDSTLSTGADQIDCLGWTYDATDGIYLANLLKNFS